MSGDKLLNVAKQYFNVAGPEKVIFSIVLYKLCARNLPGETAAVLDRNLNVTLSMHYLNRNLNGWKYWPDINFGIQ